MKFIKPRRPADWNQKQVDAALKKGYLIAMEKHDGVRLHITIDDEGNPHVYSRSLKAFPGLARAFMGMPAPFGIGLRGWTFEFEAVMYDEVGNPKTAAKTSGDLQRIDPEPLRQNQFPALYAFDIHHPEHTKGMGYGERLSKLRASRALVLQMCSMGGFRTVYYPIYTACHTQANIVAAYEQARSYGLEGLVVTPAGAPYVSDKRLGSGWKMKPEITLEATIKGFVEAIAEDGTPKGQVGSFEVAFETGDKGRINAGAMDHTERMVVWRNQGDYLGRLCEVTAMEMTEDGKARHGNFYRWRDTMENKGEKI